MRPGSASSLLLITLAFAGCAGQPLDTDGPIPKLADELLPAADPLWYNPQTFPHPAYNYPTLSNPAVGNNVSRWLQPIPAASLPEPIKGLKHVAQAQGATSSNGMSLVGSIAVLPANPTRFVDISDPQHPKAVGEFKASARASDIIVYPDGRIVTVLVSNELIVVDITDPTQPNELSRIRPKAGVHKLDIVPGTPIIYNAPSDGGAADPAFGISGNAPALAKGVTEIFDLSDPANPVPVKEFQNGYGCHRIYFYNEPAKKMFRAYCAGIEMTQIWDTLDPRDPKVIVNIPVWHGNPSLPASAIPPVTFSHFSIPSADGKILIVGDEMGGGLAAACGAYVDLPGRSASSPTGALWFYDISDEKNPQLKGWVAPSAHFATNPKVAGCTAHHGRTVPDPMGRRLLAMGYYGAGVVLVDFTDPANAKILDQFNAGTNVWEAWYYNGYVFTGDMSRGLDAIGFE